MMDNPSLIGYLHEVRMHNEYTLRHSVNVSLIAGIIGKWLKWENPGLQKLVVAGLLHDIGKLVVPLEILDKPGKLSSVEFSVIEQHPQNGYLLMKDDEQICEDVKLAILHHHERLDGSGYPRGLAKDNIHECAKIVAIADVYDAMTSGRTYHTRMVPLSALEEIMGQMHDKFDVGPCLTFLDQMRHRFIGSSVLLSDGQTAKILILPADGWSKPIVRTEDGTLLDLGKEDINVMEVFCD